MKTLESKFSSSQIGSHHWAANVLSYVMRVGEYLNKNGNDEGNSDSSYREWGLGLYERAREVNDYLHSLPCGEPCGEPSTPEPRITITVEQLKESGVIPSTEQSGGTEQEEFAMKFLEYASGLAVSNYKSGGNWYLSDGRIVKTADILKQFKEESKP